jgi:FtsP/CotA-like multicopper oxidase with cupredoxin domain
LKSPITFETTKLTFLPSHSFHYHGHNMHILQEGYGKWDGSIVNARNPARRDVHILHNAKQDGTPSYMVMQIEADNPGVWRE